MRSSKTMLSIVTTLVVLMIVTLAFIVPSGAITLEAESRYQESMPDEEGWEDDAWDDEDARARIPRLASAAVSDVLPSQGVTALDIGPDTIGSAPIAANFASDGYRDDTIVVSLEDVRRDDSVYHVAYVRIATPSQLRTAVAGGKRTYKTSVFAQSVNAVLALNGDFFTDTKAGYIIRQGETFRQKTSKNMDMLFIDELGDFHILLRGKDEQAQGVKTLMSEHTLVNGFFFGPALVVDGAVQEIPEKYQFNPFRPNPRMAIGQLSSLCYAVVAVDGRLDDSPGVTLPQLAAFMGDIGCQQAYNLDGGNSCTLVMGDRILNTISGGGERSVSDIIYFASAVDGE